MLLRVIKKEHRFVASLRFRVGKKIDATNRCRVGGLGVELRQVLLRAAAFTVAAADQRVAASRRERAAAGVRTGFDGREVRERWRLQTRTATRAVDARTEAAVLTLLQHLLDRDVLFRGVDLRDGGICRRVDPAEENRRLTLGHVALL